MNLTHIESRPSISNAGMEYDFFMDCECQTPSKEEFLTKLRGLAMSVRVMARSPSENEGKWERKRGGEEGGRERDGQSEGREGGGRERGRGEWIEGGKEGWTEGGKGRREEGGSVVKRDG